MPVYTVKAHKEIVNSIDGVGGLGIGDGAPEIVTGSRDGIEINLTADNPKQWAPDFILISVL